MANLTSYLGKLELKNPITVASGTFGSKDEFAPLVDYNCLGGIITKTITLEPWQGNPMPRIVETPSGMLNAIGLQNAGIDDFIENKIPYFEKIDTRLIVSIGGHSIREYVTLAKRLDAIKRVDAIEVNISCPNVEGGLEFCMNQEATRQVTREVKDAFSRTVIIKLSPEGNLLKSAEGAVAGGADVLSLINTIRGMSVNIKTRKPSLYKILGGMSGPAIRPLALRYLYEVKKNFKIPVLAMGGIATLEDVLEFLIVGADVISLGTINFVYPDRAQKIVQELEVYCRENKIEDLSQIRSSLKIEAGK